MKNKMADGEKLSFWELLDEYVSIEIPVIQRDYAQGRTSKEVSDIRNNFIMSIRESLINKSLLDLNFVYGSTDDDVFIPIDGQQRLTTLFLVHLYLLIVTGKDLSKKAYKRIKRFRYKTRTSSNDFCERITGRTIIIRNDAKYKDVKSISAEIKNNSWFSTAWLNDPTINSMLNMLDTINDAFKNDDADELLDLLLDEDECPIYFYFLELDKYSLEDSIYVKLNARGKALTDFENFKAKLSKYITDETQHDSKDYISKFDGVWANVFWTYHDMKSYLYDDKIMNFIIAYVINDYAVHMTQVGRDAVRNEIRTLMEYSHLEFINRFHLLTEKLDGHKIIDSFINLFSLFDEIADSNDVKEFAPGNIYIDEKQLFKWIIDGKEFEKGENKNSISYATRIRAYAYYGYLLQNGAIEQDKLEEWLRVISTLSRETNYNGGDDYVRAIKGVHKLLPHSNDILKYLAGITDTKGYGFDLDCFEEECAKACLILKSDEWKKLVLESEQNPYFNGQIGFLLEFSKIDETYKNKSILSWDASVDAQYMTAFRKYKNIMCQLFGEFSNTNGTYIGFNRMHANQIRRAMLCFGDFSLTKGYVNQSFLIDNDRDISWKRLLRIQRNDKMYQTKRSYLLSVIDDVLFDKDNINESCEKICNREIADISKTDFRYYFIKVPQIMEHINDRLIRVENGHIFLMGSTRLYGYNDEYYSYALYCLLDNDSDYSVTYKQAKGWEDIPAQVHITINTNKENWCVKYNRIDKKYYLFKKDDFANAIQVASAEDVVTELTNKK